MRSKHIIHQKFSVEMKVLRIPFSMQYKPTIFGLRCAITVPLAYPPNSDLSCVMRRGELAPLIPMHP